MANDKVKSECWFCRDTVVMELIAVEEYRGNPEKHYICPECNGANSPLRIEGELDSGKAKRVF